VPGGFKMFVRLGALLASFRGGKNVVAEPSETVPVMPTRSPIQAPDVLDAAAKINDLIVEDKPVPASTLIDYISARYELAVPVVRAGLLYLLDRGVAESAINSDITRKPQAAADPPSL
jgi:hypothetical protein